MFKAKLCEFKARLWKFNKNYWSQYFVTYGKRTVTEHSTCYIQNWSFEPFYQDYDIAFHTIYVGRVNFIYEWPFGFCPKDRIHGDYIYFQNFYKKSAERQLPKKYFFFIFRFVEYVGPGVEPWPEFSCGLTFSKFQICYSSWIKLFLLLVYL